MLKLSPSKINTYKLCPFKYKCESDTQTRKAYKKDTPDTTLGNLIHGCLNDFYKTFEKSERNYETLKATFKMKFMYHYQKHIAIFKTQERTNAYVQEAKKQLSNFINSDLSKKNPYKTEDFPTYLLNDWLTISGKYDRIDVDGKELTLIDYKTGTFREDKNIDFQLDFYHYLLSKVFPDFKVKKKILFYLKENKAIEKNTEKSLSDIEDEIIKIAEIINNDKELRPRKNNLCNYCDYKIICPLFNVI